VELRTIGLLSLYVNKDLDCMKHSALYICRFGLMFCTCFSHVMKSMPLVLVLGDVYFVTGNVVNRKAVPFTSQLCHAFNCV